MVTAKKPRYAYPLDMFMMSAPDFDASPLPPDESAEVARAFARGAAEKFPARTLVRAGIVKSYPLKGGIFWRREPIKYIIMHSTETGRPVSATRVIESWSSLGRRHPGAQYVVERDGTIYQSVDPDLGTVHVNIFKTLPGINNDNSIGIEMNHTGSQDYPEIQMQSVLRLVNYLQERYNISSENIITHRYAQQGDHTDPVNFDWPRFIARKDGLRTEALAMKLGDIESKARTWKDETIVEQSEPENNDPEPSTFLQPHMELPAIKKVESELKPKPVVRSVEQNEELLKSKTEDESPPEPSSTVVTGAPSPRIPTLRGPIETAPIDAESIQIPQSNENLIPPNLVP